MTEIQEKVLMVCGSLKYIKKFVSTEELREKSEWLKNYSVYGIDLWLHEGVKKGYIKERDRKDGTIIYQASAKGKRAYEEYHQ